MTISKDDEREAREWLGRVGLGFYETDKRHRATILALLDAPRLPRPEDVPVALMQNAINRQTGLIVSKPVLQDAYRALYDHYTAPPPKVEAWAVIHDDGDLAPFKSEKMARLYQGKHGGRIVKLVEAADE